MAVCLIKPVVVLVVVVVVVRPIIIIIVVVIIIRLQHVTPLRAYIARS